MSSSRKPLWERVLLGLMLTGVGLWVATVLLIVWWGKRDQARPAAAIVVLGAAQYVGHPSPVLRSRLDHAIALWRRGMAPVIVFTGGRGNGDTTSEAEVSRRYALKHGVPDSAILLENRGRTTSQSMEAVASIMDSRPSRRVILVSDPFHMLRLAILARQLGLRPYTSPTRTSPISSSRSESWKYVLSESVKVPAALILEGDSQ